MKHLSIFILSALLLAGCQVVVIPVPVDLPQVATAVTEVTVGVAVATAESYLPVLSDMPAGFIVKDEGLSGINADVVSKMPDPVASQKQLDDLGRLGGYYRYFEPTAFQVVGNGSIQFTLVAFKDAAGASRAVDFYRERDRLFYGAITEVSAPAIGDRSVAYMMRGENQGEDGAAPRAVDGYTYTVKKGNALLFGEISAWQYEADVNQLIDMTKRVVDRLP